MINRCRAIIIVSRFFFFENRNLIYNYVRRITISVRVYAVFLKIRDQVIFVTRLASSVKIMQLQW